MRSWPALRDCASAAVGFDNEIRRRGSPRRPTSVVALSEDPPRDPPTQLRLVCLVGRSLREVEVVAVQLVELRVLQREGVAPRRDNDVVA